MYKRIQKYIKNRSELTIIKYFNHPTLFSIDKIYELFTLARFLS